MNSIEHKIIKLLAISDSGHVNHAVGDFIRWRWATLGKPKSLTLTWGKAILALGERYKNLQELYSNTQSLYMAVDRLIKEASLVECLTSDSEYVRECKKYFQEHPDE